MARNRVFIGHNKRRQGLKGEGTSHKVRNYVLLHSTGHLVYEPTLLESENERQKIEPVPFPLPRASRNFHNVKTRNEKKSNSIYPFWEADGQDLLNFLKCQKLHFYSYPTLL